MAFYNILIVTVANALTDEHPENPVRRANFPLQNAAAAHNNGRAVLYDDVL
jgi:hypothetical protein